ncbi:hypothetical protein FH609_012695 [Streptomyces sp. 3MP-14]|uniref:Uncharacterized protein n=1 Tax=Streptomyces mimosae TaxID=2586635 RepID=A0A5N6AEJ0_9ACTN|nr:MULTISPECIES: hypothetical protein [Streptomyces]KAB8167234.1 hypothetical protein FH607_010145 [Streptomyces mimosae]KAB8177175.1 hypothetical protein FH609_012695 [Streptomyces sp. 3MP-14]
MALALMWEAKAAPGRGDDLLAWARARRLDPAPERRETFVAPQDRVLVITWWPDAVDVPPELPDPPGELLARPPHRWRFTPVES